MAAYSLVRRDGELVGALIDDGSVTRFVGDGGVLRDLPELSPLVSDSDGPQRLAFLATLAPLLEFDEPHELGGDADTAEAAVRAIWAIPG